MKRLRTLVAPLGLMLLAVSDAGADAPDSVRITSQEAWSCSRVIGIRPFALIGKFKGQQPQQAYMRVLLTELTGALRAAPDVRQLRRDQRPWG